METVGQFEKCENCDCYKWIDEKPEHFDFTVMKVFSFVRIFLKLSKPKRYSTPKQRGYFHAVIVPAYADASGLDHNSAYESLMTHFHPIEKIDPISKRVYLDRRSYNDLTTKETEDLHRDSRMLLNEYFGLILPLPNEPWGQYG